MSLLGKMMVVLGLDVQSYKTDLRKAAQDAGTSAKKIQKDFDGLNFNQFRKSLWGIQAFIAGWGVERLLTNSYLAWQENAQAVAKLEGGLRALGAYTPELSGYFKNLSNELQRILPYSDEQILAGVTELLTLGGVQPADMRRTITAAADLADTVGGMETAIDMLAKAAAGNTKMFGRWGIQVDKDLPVYEKFLSLLTKIEDRFGGMGAAAAAADPLKGIRDTWGEITENIGRAIGALDRYSGASKALSNWMEKNFNPTLEQQISKLQGEMGVISGGRQARFMKTPQYIEKQGQLNELLRQYYEGLPGGAPTNEIKRPYDPDADAKYEAWFKSVNKLETGGMRRIPLVRGASAHAQAMGETPRITSAPEFGAPTGRDATDWQSRWEQSIKNLEGQFGNFQSMFDNMNIDIVTGWDNTMRRLVTGASSFGDFVKDMFMSVADSYLGMLSRMASEKLFSATFGRIASDGLGSLFGGGTGLSATGGGGQPVTIYMQGADARQLQALLNRNTKRRG